MFKAMKNLDSAFRMVRGFCLIYVVISTVITLFVVAKCFNEVKVSQQRIYLLANGKALEAYAADRRDNIPVEARDHVKMFHHWFFTLDPDEKVIQTNLAKAMYLADASAKQQYDNLKENGYYTNLIAGNISQTIGADTITIDTDVYPFRFRYQGTQIIVRPSSVVQRSITTEGFLRNVSRSDHNPHGFLIEKWQTIDNRDIKVEDR